MCKIPKNTFESNWNACVVYIAVLFVLPPGAQRRSRATCVSFALLRDSTLCWTFVTVGRVTGCGVGSGVKTLVGTTFASPTR